MSLGLRKFLSILIVMTLIAAPPGYSLPTLQEIEAGTATFDQIDDKTLNITVSDHSIINYSSFNIAADEVVNFFMPTLDAFSLNRILDNGASQILGSLTANGNLILINTNGFYFGPAAQINVGGIVASTHDIQNSNFLNGNYLFEGLGNSASITASSILNEGTITAREGGFAVMVADAIENRGTIEAPLGTVALAAGDVVTIGLSQDGMISIAVDAETAHQILDKDGNPITDQIKNSGTLSAAGGRITLSAKAMDEIFEKAINTSGIIQANSVAVGEDGTIEFISNGINENSGAIRAKNFNESGYTFRNTETGLIDGGLDADGNAQIGNAYYDNLDGAATISGNIGSNQTDVGDLQVTGNITLTNTVIFTADSDNNGVGAFTMDNGTDINGANTYNLTIRTGQNATLRSITGVNALSLERAGNASTPVYTAFNAVSPVISLSVGTGTTLYLNGNGLGTTTFTNDGTLRLQGGENLSAFSTNDYDSGTWEFVGDGDGVQDTFTIKNFGANDYYHLTINSTDSGANKDIFQLGSSLDMDGTLIVTSGILSLNGNNIADPTGNGSPTLGNMADTIRLRGNETVFWSSNDVDSGTWEYVGDGDGVQDTFVIKDFAAAGSGDYFNLVFNSADTGANKDIFRLGATLSIEGALTITSGILSMNGNIIEDPAGGATATLANIADTLRLQGNETVFWSTNDTDSGTWEYVGDGDSNPDNFTIKDFGGTDYYNLIINSTDSNDDFTSAAAKSVSGALTVSQGELITGNLALTVGGLATVNGGTLTYGNDVYTFNGGLTVSSGTFSGHVDAGIDINGNFLQSGGTVTLPDSQTSISGNFTHSSGTFNAGAGTVVLDGTNQTISGSTTFYGLTKIDSSNNSTDLTLTFDNASTQTVTGTLTLTGIDADDRINLVSDSPGTRWELNCSTCTRNISWADVRDSDASSGTTITYSNTISSGNNLNWGFTGISSTWAGSLSSVWSLAGNWSNGVPGADDTAIIADVATDPVLDMNVSLTDLTINTGGLLSLSGFNLLVSGTFSNDGRVIARGNETLTLTNDVNSGTWDFRGDGDGVLDTYTLRDFGVTDYYNLIINATDSQDVFQSGAGKVVAGTLTISRATYDANGNATTVTGLTDIAGLTSVYTAGSGTQTFNGGLTVSAGAFNGSANGTVDVNGNVDITGGDVTGSGNSGSFTVSGNWQTTSGSFVHNSGTVTFDGSGTQTLQAGGSAFNNLTHSGTSTLQLSVSSISMANLTNSAGVFNLNGQDLTISGTEDNTATVRLRGSETISIGTHDTNSGTWEYIGDGDSNLDPYTIKDFGATDYFNLTIASTDSSDTYSIAGTHSNAGAFTVSSGVVTASSTTTTTGLTTISGGSLGGFAGQALQTFNGGLTISGGSFNGTGSTMDVNGDFTQSNGTFTAPGSLGSFNVSGNFNRSNGTFTHNSGTVTFDGTTTLTSNGATFNNMTIGTNAASGSVTLADNLDINGTLAFNTTGGTTSLTATSRTINYAGSTLNFTNLDTFSASGSTWIFDGTTTLTSASKQLGNVTIGTNTASGSLTLADNADFFGDFTFNTTGGTTTLDMTNRTMSVGNTALNMTNLDNFTSTGSTLSFFNTMTLTSAGKTFNNITFGGASPSLTLGDNLDMNGVFDFTAGSSTFDMTNAVINYAGSTLNFTGLDTFTNSGSQFIFDGTTTLTSAGKALNNVTIGTNTASGSVTLADTADINGTLSFNTTGGTAALDSSNRTVNYAGSALNLTNADTFTTTSSTWVFDGTTSLTSAGKTFNNVTIGTNSASGSLTLRDAADINGSLDFNTSGGTTTLDISNTTLNYAGTNFILLDLDTFTVTGSTLVLDGTADQSLRLNGKSLNHFTVNNTGVAGSDDIIFTGNLDVDGIFTLTDGNFHAPAVMNVADDFLFAGGTFDANNGDVILDTTTTATVNVNGAGTGTLDFFDFTIATGGKTVQFGAGDTFNILSATTWTVTGSAGNLVTLESTGGSAWNVNAAGTNVSYASIANANNTGAAINCGAGCVDGGGNTGFNNLISNNQNSNTNNNSAPPADVTDSTLVTFQDFSATDGVDAGSGNASGDSGFQTEGPVVSDSESSTPSESEGGSEEQGSGSDSGDSGGSDNPDDPDPNQGKKSDSDDKKEAEGKKEEKKDEDKKDEKKEEKKETKSGSDQKSSSSEPADQYRDSFDWLAQQMNPQDADTRVNVTEGRVEVSYIFEGKAGNQEVLGAGEGVKASWNKENKSPVLERQEKEMAA